MTSDPISRQALEEAWSVCLTHDSAHPQPKGEPWRCHWNAWREQASIYFDEDGIRHAVVIDDCRFESQVRIRVAP